MGRGGSGDVLEVGLFEHVELLGAEDTDGVGEVVDLDGERGGPVGGGEEGIGVVDVDLAGDEGFADGEDAAIAGWDLHDDDFGLSDGEAGVGDATAGGVGVVDEEPDDGAVDGAFDGKGEDFDIEAVEDARQPEQLTDAVFEEDGELAAPLEVAALGGVERLDVHAGSCGRGGGASGGFADTGA